jgi:mono/diheme cytochrome c family protein
MRTRTTLLLGGCLLLASLAACSGGAANPSSSTGQGSTSGASSGGAGGPSARDPFAPQPDTSEGLTNVSSDLDALLEKGALQGACAAYASGQKDRRTKLLCGKYTFFYESFGTTGVPTALVSFLLDNFPDEIGPGFEKLGMIPDPGSAAHLPLGLAPGAKLGGSIDTLSFTCASCHFSRLPDGRYAVGGPNHAYEYGKQNLAIAVFPMVALLGGESNHDPDAIAVIKPLLDRMSADPSLKTKLIGSLSGLIGGGAMVPSFPKEAEHHYASWKPGTMDFAIEPLPINDGVHTVSKISALWGLPDEEEIAASGMSHAMLGWTGGTRSLLSFARQFVTFGGGSLAEWPDEALEPLVDYIHSLRAPESPSAQEASLVDEGKALFASKQCTSCHDGPRGSGKHGYSYEEIGTDAALERWLDPELAGEACCKAPVPEDEKKVTHQIKSPRLNGTWAMARFLHNGSVDSLEDLFCLNGPRGTITEEAFGDAGHDFTCAGLDEGEKKALIAYLRAH